MQVINPSVLIIENLMSILGKMLFADLKFLKFHKFILNI